MEELEPWLVAINQGLHRWPFLMQKKSLRLRRDFKYVRVVTD
jgi:hypothetical protein